MRTDDLPPGLRPYESILGKIVRDGLMTFHAAFLLQRARMSIRSVRSTTHDCLVEAAKKTGLQWRLNNNLFTLIIDEFVFKVKKFNVRLETANYPTQAVFRFDAPRQLHLFGEPVNLYLGYVPHPLDIRQSTVWIVSRTKGDMWSYAIPAAKIEMPVVTPATTTEAVPAKKRAVAKKTKLKKADEA